MKEGFYMLTPKNKVDARFNLRNIQYLLLIFSLTIVARSTCAKIVLKE